MPKPTLTIRIDDLAAGGDGVGRLSGKVCFVPRSVPGDVVEARTRKSNKKFSRLEIERVVEPGPGRIEPMCPHFEVCGGCQWQHIDYASQLQAKQRILLGALFGRDDPGVDVQMVASPNPFFYRGIARLHGDANSGALGFMKRQGNEVVGVDECPILDMTLGKTLSLLKRTLTPLATGRFEARLAASTDGPGLAITGFDSLPQDVYETARGLVSSGFAGVVADLDGMVSLLAGKERLSTAGVDGEALVEPIHSFGQANSGVNLEMGRTVTDWVEAGRFKRAVELFSGAGNLSVGLAPRVSRLATVELDAPACDAAKQNVRNRGLEDVTVHRGDALELYRSLGAKAELVVLDPPRTGHHELARALAKGKHQAILYVSCNPATLSRDIKELAGAGYVLKAARGFDMFPQTSHIEAAVLLER